MSTFRNLQIWQKFMALVTKLYKSTQQFPKEEIFGLTSQLRRCSVSIPSNIAEGFGRKSNVEFYRYLNIATASLFEMQTQIEIAHNIGYLNASEFETLYNDTRELEIMIVSFAKKLKNE